MKLIGTHWPVEPLCSTTKIHLQWSDVTDGHGQYEKPLNKTHKFKHNTGLDQDWYGIIKDKKVGTYWVEDVLKIK